MIAYSQPELDQRRVKAYRDGFRACLKGAPRDSSTDEQEELRSAFSDGWWDAFPSALRPLCRCGAPAETIYVGALAPVCYDCLRDDTL